MSAQSGTRSTPIVMGIWGCSHCGCPSLRVIMNSMSGGTAVDHLDLVCPVCDKFVAHVDCAPHEQAEPQVIIDPT